MELYQTTTARGNAGRIMRHAVNLGFYDSGGYVKHQLLARESRAMELILEKKHLLQYGEILRMAVDQGRGCITVVFDSETSSAACIEGMGCQMVYNTRWRPYPSFIANSAPLCPTYKAQGKCNKFDCILYHESADEVQYPEDKPKLPESAARRYKLFYRPEKVFELLLAHHHSNAKNSSAEMDARGMVAQNQDKSRQLQDGSKNSNPNASYRDSPSSPMATAVREGENNDRRIVHQLHVPGILAGNPVTAVPDFGSSFDIVSEEFAKCHGFFIIPQNVCSYTLPNGVTKQFVGKIVAFWRFDAESVPYQRVFHVLKDCVHPVVLGRGFLKLTETLSKYRNRVKKVLVHCTQNFQRLLLLNSLNSIAGSTERILGLINGRPVPGFADTCSDISIIKRSVAQQLGLDILEGPEYQIEVQFIDQSTAFTTGLVRDVSWCFSASLSPEDSHKLAFYIMDDIPCAVILDKWLLWDNDAFVDYSDCFFNVGECQTSDVNPVCLIQVKRSKKKLGAADAFDEEATRRVEEDDRIAELPVHLQVAALAEEQRRRQNWEQNRTTTNLPIPLPPTPAPSLPQNILSRHPNEAFRSSSTLNPAAPEFTPALPTSSLQTAASVPSIDSCRPVTPPALGTPTSSASARSRLSTRGRVSRNRFVSWSKLKGLITPEE